MRGELDMNYEHDPRKVLGRNAGLHGLRVATACNLSVRTNIRQSIETAILP